MADALDTILRLRRTVLDVARSALAERIDAEHAARLTFEAACRDIARETQAAADSDADDMVERFAAWLPVGKARRAQAESVLERAAAATTIARAELAVARSSYEAALELQTRRRAERRRKSEHAEQVLLEEAASASRLGQTRGLGGP